MFLRAESDSIQNLIGLWFGFSIFIAEVSSGRVSLVHGKKLIHF